MRGDGNLMRGFGSLRIMSMSSLALPSTSDVFFFVETYVRCSCESRTHRQSLRQTDVRVLTFELLIPASPNRNTINTALMAITLPLRLRKYRSATFINFVGIPPPRGDMGIASILSRVMAVVLEVVGRKTAL